MKKCKLTGLGTARNFLDYCYIQDLDYIVFESVNDFLSSEFNGVRLDFDPDLFESRGSFINYAKDHPFASRRLVSASVFPNEVHFMIDNYGKSEIEVCYENA